MDIFEIQSNSNGMAEVERYISRLCDEKHVRNHQGIIWSAVEAAVENAIVHGNRNDASKKVSIECGDCDGGIFFTISDQGNGFDPSAVEEGRGVGLFMMRRLADNIGFNAQGNAVRLEFFIRGIDRELTLERISILNHYFAKNTIQA